MWKNLITGSLFTDEELAVELLSMKRGVAVIETRHSGTSKYVICQLRKKTDDCVVLTVNQLADELVRGIVDNPGDSRQFMRELIREEGINILIVTPDIAAKHATQTEFGYFLRELSKAGRKMIVICEDVKELPYMLPEMGNNSCLFCYEE